jgi:hypothetical protein
MVDARILGSQHHRQFAAEGRRNAQQQDHP